MKRDVTEPRMRSRIFTAAALVFGLALAGCESFDPLDKLSELDIMGTSKKPLPGERRPVFESGVPGVPQGVPPELVKGYQPPPEASPPVIEAKPEKKPKPKKTAVRRAPPPQQQQQQQQRQTQQQPQTQQQQQQLQQAPAAQTTTQSAPGSAAAWPTMPGAQPTWPTNAPPAPGPWPAPQR